MELFFVCVFFSFVLFTVGDLRKSCHPVFGAFGSSKGGSHCIPLSSYDNKHQWATCLSDSYIRQKSKGSHVCRDKDRTYCWYQCMNEVHDIDKGKDIFCIFNPHQIIAPGNLRTKIPTLCTYHLVKRVHDGVDFEIIVDIHF